MAKDRLDIPFDLTGKKIWVAGHRGMVGSAICRRLSSEDCQVLTVGREELDLRNQTCVRQWVGDQKPDVVVLAAAKVGGIKANDTYRADFFYDNIMINTNVLHSCYECQVQRALVLGSSCIYPRDCVQPITEEMLLTGKLESTNEAYALAKIAGLKMAEYYRTQFGCDFISAMPCNLFGVGDKYDTQNSHVIPALIMKAHAAKIQNAETLTVWGSGSALREFMDADDLADALVYVLRHYCGFGPINVGSGQEISIKKLIQITCEVIDFKGEIIFDTTFPDGTLRKVMDSSRLFKLGWEGKLCQNDDINMSKKIKNGILKCYGDYLSRVLGNGCSS